ncbi:MAG: DUF1552 domain-containing protein [Opitutae bacterium]|nr:DUF1552 domain-containing protein [Opitutae bacterium]MBT5380198.1 DUF1552 domain-containing protein [Opitutae bacterium]
MHNRRSFFKGIYLGAGSVALSPFLQHLRAAEEGALPKRFVFVVKSSGLQADFLNPEGLKHGGGEIVDSTLEGKKLPESMASLEPFKDKLSIIQGLSGRMATWGHSGFYGALGAYKASAHSQPAYATIDGHLSKLFPSVFNHIGLKMGNGSQGTAYPSISALGKNQQLSFQCNPQLAYQNLYGSIAAGGDIKKKYTRTSNVLDAMSADIKKLQNTLPSEEREKLGHYLHGYEALKDRRVKLVGMQDVLRKHAPEVSDKYTSRYTTDHLDAHFDMGTAALISGISNVITFHCDDLDSSYQGLGITPKVHSIGHGASSGSMSSQVCRNKIRTFHVELIAGMATKLAAVPEGDGTMLDNTLIVYVSDNSDKHHSGATEWPMFALGNIGGKLKNNGGRYIAYPRYGSAKHQHTIGNWLTTITHVAGKPQDHFGQPDFALGKLEDQMGPLNELLA